ncbi:hypothetical protein ACQEVG_00165 [Streptomyces sp. CA-135486]
MCRVHSANDDAAARTRSKRVMPTAVREAISHMDRLLNGLHRMAP